MATQKQIDGLPVWARKVFENDQAKINRLLNEISGLEKASKIMAGRTLEIYNNLQGRFFTLGTGDIVIVARKKKKQ